MTKDTDTALDAKEIEITPEMIEAGVEAYLDSNNSEYFNSIEWKVSAIYRAMFKSMALSETQILDN